MSYLKSPRRRWWLLVGFWVVMLVLGIGGFRQQAADAGVGRSNLDTLYLTLQLLTLDYDSSDALNWRLEIARFVAPLVAAGTIAQTVSVVFRDQFTRLRLRFSRGHTVVIGLGGAGSRLVAALVGAGRRVVAIDRDPGAPGVGTARELDVPVLTGDATDPLVLGPLRLDRAAQVVVVSGSDATNVELTVAIRGVARAAGRPPLRCSVHLTDAELCTLLRGADLRAGGGVRTDFFNLHERAARTWVAEHNPFGDGSRPPHLVVLGLGQLGRSIVVAAAQRWVERGEGSLRVTLVDRMASGRWQALLLQHPALAEACAARLVGLDIDAPTAESVDAFREVLSDGPPTAVAVAFEDESLALSTGLLVQQELPPLPGSPIPVVVRTHTDTGLGGLLRPVDGAAPFPGMAVFPFLDRACTLEVVDGGVREQLARSIHEDYLARSRDDPRRAAGALLFQRRWEDLEDEAKESSRSAADGVLEGLAAVGYHLVPLRHWGGAGVSLSGDEVDRLAAREHERWRAERERGGWRHGPERDDERKLNPFLVPWDELPDAVRAANVESARRLPAMLARAGFEFAPLEPAAP